jgi:5-methyltetrahydrofolate--homocysteine methyltransferase
MNPLHAETKAAVLAADVLMGADENCATWIRANRDPNAPAGEGARAGRESRRRRRE